MRTITLIYFGISLISQAQQWEAKTHPNTKLKAIAVDTVLVSGYLYTEISEWSENKAYVAQGGLYAYVNKRGEELSPYIFVEASNFKEGYAVIGDSFNRSVINDSMRLLVPLLFAKVRRPQLGLILVQSHQGKWGAYDISGDNTVPLVYDLPPYIVSLDKIIVRKEGQYGVINNCNDVVYNCTYQYISAQGRAYKSGKFIRLF